MKQRNAVDVRSTSTRYSTRARAMASVAMPAVLGLLATMAHAQSYTCPNTSQNFFNSSPAGTPSGTIQSFVVPSGSVTIDAVGAQGGMDTYDGGWGAEVVSTFYIVPGQTLCVVAGAQGGGVFGGTISGGGGGGSFVYAIASGTCVANLPLVNTSSAPNLLIAAGGGAGGTHNGGDVVGIAPTGAGTLGASFGGSGSLSGGGTGGVAGNGGNAGVNNGGGGGLFTDGTTSTTPGQGGSALINGAAGGINNTNTNGGFGGGGASGSLGSGGGGGYNGGGGGGLDNSVFPPVAGHGGGGGSFTASAPLSPYTHSGIITGNSGSLYGNGTVSLCYPADLIFSNDFEPFDAPRFP